MKTKSISLVAAVLLMAAGAACGQQPSATQFDGHELYQQAVQQFIDNSINLRDAAVRAKWAAEWLHKHDSDHVLDTEEGADQAVDEMMHSLGNRFDYYFLPEDTQQEAQDEDPSLTGVGLAIAITGGDSVVAPILAGVPPKPTMRQKNQLERQIETALHAMKVGPDHRLQIMEVNQDGPSVSSGLKAGDRIVSIDGQSLDGLTADQITAKLRGKENTSVTVVVERADSTGKYVAQPAITIVRKAFITHVVHAKDLGNGVTYISITNFDSKYEVSEMEQALVAAAKGKATIIDLRGNPGGIMQNGEAIAEMLMKSGIIDEMDQRQGDDLITQRLDLEPAFDQTVVISSKDPKTVHVGKPEGREDELLPDDMPLIVLVDGDSYSCSEILAGTLQANHRALIVGQPTGGKGVGQLQIPLPYGRSLHVTNFEFRPGGKAIDWVGVIPNVIVPQPQVDPKTLAPGAVPPDAQLQAATKLVLQMVASQDALHQLQDQQRQKHEKDFKDGNDQ